MIKGVLYKGWRHPAPDWAAPDFYGSLLQAIPFMGQLVSAGEIKAIPPEDGGPELLLFPNESNQPRWLVKFTSAGSLVLQGAR